MKLNIFGFAVTVEKVDSGSMVRWSDTKKAWTTFASMHPYHLLNALRKDLPEISNEQIFGEAHEYFSEWFSRLAEATKEREVK